MPHFRKKPIVIEAQEISWYGDMHRITEWIEQNGGKATYGQEEYRLGECGPAEMRISTLEGMMTARVGDFIIKGVKGEFYPCKSDIFHATYECVAERD